MRTVQQIAKLLGAGCCVLSLAVDAAVFNVNSTSSLWDINHGDGVCADTVGQCTLRAALEESNAHPGVDTINLPANTYTRSFSITDGVILVGAGSATTFIDGQNLSVHTDEAVSISGLTLRNGTGTSSSGIFLGPDGDLTLSDVKISNFAGAGIVTSSLGINQLTINSSLIELNKGSGTSTRWGGGMYLQGSGNVVITDTTISGNSASFGGGIYLKGTTLALTSSTISGNSSTAAINVNGGFGGGAVIVSGSGSFTLINSTISGNEAVSSGGGIVIDDGTVSLYSTTVTDNRADSDSDLAGSGGGIIATTGFYSSTNALTLRNSIVAQNSAALNKAIDCSSTNATITSFGYNLIGSGTDTDCLITPAAGDQFGTVFSIDPLLGALADNGGATQSHLLTADSPAINAGNPASCDDASATPLIGDQRGFTRPVDGGTGSARCDIGSIEMYILPVANAGPDQVVQYGETVTLTGASSTAFAGVDTFSWSENPASSVTLNNALTSTASFTAPDTAGDLVFELKITDNNADMDTDSVTVSVNAPPVADAGPNATVYAGNEVILDGAASADLDGTIDGYSWSQTVGTGVMLNNADTKTPSFTADLPEGEVLNFELTVTDNSGAQHTDRVKITVGPSKADVVKSILKSVKKLQKTKSIKKDTKSKKYLYKAKLDLDEAYSYYLRGLDELGATHAKRAIKDFRKVRKSKSNVKKLIKKLEALL